MRACLCYPKLPISSFTIYFLVVHQASAYGGLAMILFTNSILVVSIWGFVVVVVVVVLLLYSSFTLLYQNLLFPIEKLRKNRQQFPQCSYEP